ncbi:MAG: hypothetical protein H0X29_04530 [Parachlamydiaceae bacterium]|nr:hypothetical protein [Parachlamydiaceae bacterium]
MSVTASTGGVITEAWWQEPYIPPSPTNKDLSDIFAANIPNIDISPSSEVNPLLSPISSCQNQLLNKDKASYYVGGKIHGIRSTAAVIFLINCFVTTSILFVDEKGESKEGGIVIMDNKSKIGDLEHTNAEIVLRDNLLES